jgi:ABC-type glycerol-3-phosphate transport system substrate-binding protein
MLDRYIKRMIIGSLIGLWTILFSLSLTANADVDETYDAKTDQETSGSLETLENVNSYRSVYQKWLDQDEPMPRVQHVVEAETFMTDLPVEEMYGVQAIGLGVGDAIEIDLTVEETGLYEIWIDYLIVDERIRNPELKKEIAYGDQPFEIQYNEDAGILLDLVYEKELSEPRLDRYGDEIPISVKSVEKWIKDYPSQDPAAIIKEPLKNRLQAGQNTIRLTLNNSVELYVSKVTISNSIERKDYEDYLADHLEQGATRPLDVRMAIDAEDYARKSSTSISTFSVMEPHMSQYRFNKRYMNAIEIKRANQWIEYEVDVEEAGLYKIGLKAELTKQGLPVYRRIEVNGIVPFEAFNHLRIDFQKGWNNFVLSDRQEPYEVYLNQGINTIRIETSPGLNVHFEAIDAILDDIQDLTMEITSLTGGIADRDRTWDIVSYIPDIVDRLEKMKEGVLDQYERLTSYSNEKAAQFNILRVAANQLDELIQNPDLIVEKAYLLNEGTSSTANILSRSLTELMDEPMRLDQIYVFSEAELPRADSPWYVNMWEQLKMFFYSFFDPRYDLELSDDPDVVRIWVSRSKLHVELMQRMADEGFTRETGIDVEMMVLPNQNRIVLANAAGKTPDLVVSQGGQTIYDYASRNMLADLSEMEGFQEVAADFQPNTFVPYIFEDGVYAMPETQDVALLFYRTDILSSLDLSVPDTLEEVLGMLPLLQSLGMNFYHPISGSAATKSINHMSPLIYQQGGELYGMTASDVAIREPSSVQAIKYMIDLYNVYNLPLQVGSFYDRFRSGTLPIGIGDQNMYIQLKYAAPELIGQWGVAPIPGVRNDEGVVERWDTALGTAGFIFDDSKNKERAWEFLKWWSSSEIQAEFSYELISNFGELFLNMTANIDGFIDSAWPEDSKEAILAQWEWIRIPPRMPGYYIMERELSNVYNKAVFDRVNYRNALDEAYFNITREINRKLDEFGYGPNRTYRIPNNENIHEWIGE